LSRLTDLFAPAVAIVLTVAPIGGYVLLMLLVVLADVAIALFIARLIAARRKAADASVVSMEDAMPIALRRRTEPALRARRPAGVVEMQVRWRHAVEAHRRTRQSS
jgi:hypothetical protein